jgi:hypothetical protein
MIGPNEVNALIDLALLFGFHWIEKELGDFLEDGYLNVDQAVWARACALVMLDRIRSSAAALVDVNDISDFGLKSALGRYNGYAYPAILEASKSINRKNARLPLLNISPRIMYLTDR